MNREFLEGLGLEKDAINAIMAKHGSTIGDKETEITNLKNEKKTLDDKITQLENAGDDDDDGELKKQLKALEDDKKDLKQQLADQSKQHKLETYVNGLGTKDTAYVTAKLEDVELNEDGEFEGIDEHVEELKEAHPLLFEADEQEEQTPPPKPKPWSQRTNATVEGGTWTREKIMEVEDVNERQKLIRENRDLFK